MHPAISRAIASRKPSQLQRRSKRATQAGLQLCLRICLASSFESTDSTSSDWPSRANATLAKVAGCSRDSSRIDKPSRDCSATLQSATRPNLRSSRNRIGSQQSPANMRTGRDAAQASPKQRAKRKEEGSKVFRALETCKRKPAFRLRNTIRRKLRAANTSLQCTALPAVHCIALNSRLRSCLHCKRRSDGCCTQLMAPHILRCGSGSAASRC